MHGTRSVRIWGQRSAEGCHNEVLLDTNKVPHPPSPMPSHSQVGHALVASCAELLLPTQAASVDRLSIIPRSGGALGFTYMPPKTEDRALMFDR